MTDSPPKTRKDKKKDQREKANGLNGKYSAKHARLFIAKQQPFDLRNK